MFVGFVLMRILSHVFTNMSRGDISGFFAWYRGLATDPMRVSQAQLVQPFLSMLIAVPLLGERISVMAITFCLAIIATVALSRQLR